MGHKTNLNLFKEQKPSTLIHIESKIEINNKTLGKLSTAFVNNTWVQGEILKEKENKIYQGLCDTVEAVLGQTEIYSIGCIHWERRKF